MNNEIERCKIDAMMKEIEALGIAPAEQMALMDAVLRASGYEPETLRLK